MQGRQEAGLEKEEDGGRVESEAQGGGAEAVRSEG